MARRPRKWEPELARYLPALYEGDEPDPTQTEMDLRQRANINRFRKPA
jgi:hypothetical protein